MRSWPILWHHGRTSMSVLPMAQQARPAAPFACAAGALAIAVAGCSGEDVESAPDLDARSAVACPVTGATPTEDLPEVLRGTGGRWTGTEGLWAGVPERTAFITDDGTIRLKHAWVTLDEEGQPTDEHGDPGVRLQRLDGAGSLEASHGGYATDASLSWWPTGVEFPAPGCWAETGTVNGVELRVVFEVPGP